MATKKTASVSASVKRINAKIDAINRGKNPAERGKQIFVPTRSKQKALDFANAKYGIDAGIAVKSQGGFVVYQAYDTLPKEKKAVRNPIKPTITDRKKQLPDFRYLVQVEGTSGDGDWFSEAAFRLLSRAEEYAHALHKKLKTASVRVLARD